MRIAARSTQLAIIALVSVWLFSGCTDWKKKHDGLEVELQNLQGRYENCMAGIDTKAADVARLSQALAAAQQELAALKKGTKPSGFEGLPWEVDENRGTITVTLENTILFASGMAEVKSSVIPELDKIASVLQKNYRGKDVSVVGHTDTDPINKTKNLYKDNWDLSAARSLAVLRYLVKRGIRPEGIKAVAAGEFRPAQPGSSATAKTKNRRVEVVVHMF